MRAAFVASSLIALSLILAAAGCAQELPAAASQPSARDVEELAARAREAANAHNITTLAALASNPASVEWSKHVTGRAKTTGWTVTTVTPPAGALPPLVVFSAPNAVESTGDHVHTAAATPAGARIGPEIEEADTGGYQVVDHNLTIRFDLPAHSCTAEDEVTVNRHAGAQPYLLLRLSSDFTCQSVKVDGAQAHATWVPGIILVAPPPGSASFHVTVAYRGAAYHSAWDLIGDREALLTSYWYPHTGRLPARSTIHATVPKGWHAIAPGELVAVTPKRHTQVFQYRNEIPVCYISFAAAPYTPVTRNVNGRKLTIYQLKPSPEIARQSLDQLAQALDFYERTFGHFPYTHYDLVETLGTEDAALEGYSFAVFAPSALPDTVAHELAHTWWGGIVPCTYLHSMWDESLANYSEALFRRVNGHSSDPAVRGLHTGPQDLPDTYRVPVAAAYDTEDNQHNEAGYEKGSIVLGMLEDMIGRDKLMRCLRRLIADHVSGTPAEWSDVEQAVHRETGADYGWFFRQWLDRSGVPVVGIAEAHATPMEGGWTTEATIEQTGTPYRVTVPVVVTAEGKAERAIIQLDGPKTGVRVTTMARPTRIEVDPDGTVLLRGVTGGSSLRRDL